MSRIYRKRSVHPVNWLLDEMTGNAVCIHDIDCIYRNIAKDFWLMFEWKNPGETMGSTGTLQSLQEIDEAFSNADPSYKGAFVVRFGFSIDTFPLDNTQQMEVVHMRDGILVEGKTYPDGARNALQHILDYGRLL
jgi:hypothetical protein